MKKLRHTSAFTLLLLAAMPLLVAACFLVCTAVNEHRVFEAFESGQSRHYTFAKHQILWIEEGRELLTGNRMFDVMSFTELGDSVKVTGIFDDEEGRIREIFNILTGSARHTSTGNHAALALFFIPAIVFDNTGLSIEIYNSLHTPHRVFQEDIVNGYGNMDTPPPQASFSA